MFDERKALSKLSENYSKTKFDLSNLHQSLSYLLVCEKRN